MSKSLSKSISLAVAIGTIPLLVLGGIVLYQGTAALHASIDVEVRPDLSETIRWILPWYLGLSVALVATSMWLVRRAVRKGLRPLDALAQDVESSENRITALNLENAPREIRPLIERLNILLQDCHATLQREHRFTADAAHELRTPLAVLRTEVEVALRKKEGGNHRAVLEGTLDSIEDLSSLVDSLLLISRSDTDSIESETEVIDLLELVQSCWNRIQAVVNRRGMKLEVALDLHRDVRTDVALLRSIITNLLANAAAYAPEGTTIEVTSPNDKTIVAVTNIAPDLTEEDVSNLFQRFWRRDNARSDTSIHSGLGLSVVMAAAKAIRAQVHASLEDGRLTITLSQKRKLPLS